MSGKKHADKMGAEKPVTEKTGTDKTGAERPVRLRPRAPCPICAKPSVQRYHPFCSVRCADIDLGRWLGGRYAIPATDPGEEDEEADSPEPSGAHPIRQGWRKP